MRKFKFIYLDSQSKYHQNFYSKDVVIYQEMRNGCHFVINKKRDRDGYIIVRIDRKDIKLHRFIYEQIHGKIKKGLVIRHSCDNPSCINPKHLLCGTQAENIKDREKRKKLKESRQITHFREDSRKIRNRSL